MKKFLTVFLGVVSAINLASASNNFSYTATADPNASPDAIDQNSNSVDVWTVTTVPGQTGSDGSGSYYGTQDSLANAWQMYSYQNSGVGHGGSAYATTTFPGGALAVGQTVSINFNMRALDNASGNSDLSTNGQAGISLLNGSGNAITFGIIGGGPNHYYYTDASSTNASAGAGLSYQYQNPFNIAITVTGTNTYSATAFNAGGSDHWTGTFSGSLIACRYSIIGVAMEATSGSII